MSLPYMPFYVKDYEAKTAWLTLAQDGAYNRLLRLCWMTPGCSVPNDPEWIAQRLRVSPSDYETVVKPVIDAFFKVSRGRVFNPKQREVFRDAKAVSKKRSSAGVRGALKRKALKNNEKDLSRAKAGLKQPKPKPNNTNNTLSHNDRSVCGDGSDRERDLEFERVWEIYPCTVATSRKRAEAAWRELTPERRLLAVAEAERLASLGEPQTLYPADFLEGIPDPQDVAKPSTVIRTDAERQARLAQLEANFPKDEPTNDRNAA